MWRHQASVDEEKLVGWLIYNFSKSLGDLPSLESINKIAFSEYNFVNGTILLFLARQITGCALLSKYTHIFFFKAEILKFKTCLPWLSQYYCNMTVSRVIEVELWEGKRQFEIGQSIKMTAFIYWEIFNKRIQLASSSGFESGIFWRWIKKLNQFNLLVVLQMRIPMKHIRALRRSIEYPISPLSPSLLSFLISVSCRNCLLMSLLFSFLIIQNNA